MVFEDQAGLAWSREALKEERGGESADAPADDHAIVDFARVDGVGRSRIVGSVAHLVAGEEHFHGVAVGDAVLTDAAVAGPFVVGGEQLERVQALEQGSTGGEESSTYEIAAGDGIVGHRVVGDSLR